MVGQNWFLGNIVQNSFINIALLHYFEILLLLMVCQSQIFLLNENPQAKVTGGTQVHLVGETALVISSLQVRLSGVGARWIRADVWIIFNLDSQPANTIYLFNNSEPNILTCS